MEIQIWQEATTIFLGSCNQTLNFYILKQIYAALVVIGDEYVLSNICCGCFIQCKTSIFLRNYFLLTWIDMSDLANYIYAIFFNLSSIAAVIG